MIKVNSDEIKKVESGELSQAIFRSVMVAASFSWTIYLVLSKHKHGSYLVSVVMGFYTLFCILVTLHIKHRPKYNRVRITVMILSDPILLYITSRLSLEYSPDLFAFFFGLFVAPAIGNALRFGRNYLLPAAFANFAGLLVTILTIPYYHDNPIFSFGLALTFILVAFRVGIEVEALDKTRKKLAELAMHDSLTGLPNRRLFVELLQKMIAVNRRTKGKVACFFIDLDGFKAVNDQHGHGTGDTLIKRIGDILRKNSRDSDVIARLSGDEFVFAAHCDEPAMNIIIVAERILHAIEGLRNIDGLEIKVSASIGVAFDEYSPPVCSEEACAILIDKADKAMYSAKKQGKGRIIISQ